MRISDSRTEALVCLECMVRQGNDRLRLAARFMAALAMPMPQTVPPVPPAMDEAAVCPACGVNFGRVMASGLLGCAACYDAFRDAVEAGEPERRPRRVHPRGEAQIGRASCRERV
mgnify:CR=1 FL=1